MNGTPVLKIVLCLCAMLMLASVGAAFVDTANHPNATRRMLSSHCDPTAPKNERYTNYFDDMNKIYRGQDEGTCLPLHQKCGWPQESFKGKKLPLYVLVVGLEGSGHHFWTKLLYDPLFQCNWVNARHYRRDVEDGVPRRTPWELETGLKEQFAIRRKEVPKDPVCMRIVDTEDSFPTGAIRKAGRLFMHPDIVNLQHLHGSLLNVKYLLISRNTTDTAMSAMRRDFVTSLDQAVHTAEHTLIHVEAALRGVSCHQVMVAHYEHVLAKPSSFYGPLSDFLELNQNQQMVLKGRLTELKAKMPSRKEHKLTHYQECKELRDKKACYEMIKNKMDRFFNDRGFMWPTFAANGYDLEA